MPKRRRRRKGTARQVRSSRSGVWQTIGIVFATAIVVSAIIWGVNTSAGGPNRTAATQPGDVQRIALDQARAWIAQDEAILYDVRSADSYRASHAQGAVSLPESDVASLIGTLPQGKGLILY